MRKHTQQRCRPRDGEKTAVARYCCRVHTIRSTTTTYICNNDSAASRCRAEKTLRWQHRPFLTGALNHHPASVSDTHRNNTRKRQAARRRWHHHTQLGARVRERDQQQSTATTPRHQHEDHQEGQEDGRHLRAACKSVSVDLSLPLLISLSLSRSLSLSLSVSSVSTSPLPAPPSFSPAWARPRSPRSPGS